VPERVQLSPEAHRALRRGSNANAAARSRSRASARWKPGCSLAAADAPEKESVPDLIDASIPVPVNDFGQILSTAGPTTTGATATAPDPTDIHRRRLDRIAGCRVGPSRMRGSRGSTADRHLAIAGFPAGGGLPLAGPHWPDPLLLALFAVGAVACAGAGCTLNDIATASTTASRTHRFAQYRAGASRAPGDRIHAERNWQWAPRCC